MTYRIPGQNQRYVDQFYQQTIGSGGYPNDAAKQISNLYGPPKWPLTQFDPNERRAHESKSLFQAREGEFEIQPLQINLQLEKLTGWHLEAFPAERTTVTTVVARYRRAPRFALDLAPEGVPPRYVVIQEETHYETLRRYNLGATISQDHMMTLDGKEEMAQKEAIVISGATITGKLVVEQAIIHAKDHYKEWQRQNGVLYAGFREALENEVRWFGMFNKDLKALYKLHEEAKAIVRLSGNDFNLDRIVLCPGALGYLSIGNVFETEPQRRGAIAQTTLTLGARAFSGILSDAIIMENADWRVDNISKEEYNVFRRLKVIGVYVMLDGSAADGLHDNAIWHNDLSSDSQYRYTQQQAIKESMRFNAKGELHDHIYKFAKRVPDELARTGISGVKHIDPYIWVDTSSMLVGTDGTIEAASLDAKNIHVIGLWGDMDQRFFTFEHTLAHGRQVAEILRNNGSLSHDDMENVRDYFALSHELSDISLDSGSDKAVIAYVDAVLGNAQNTVDNSRIVKRNNQGSIQLDLANAAVTAVSRPWGFSTINHLRYLATLGAGVPASWVPYIERAKKVVKSIDRYIYALIPLYRDSAIASARYVPEFARSGIVEHDTIAAIVMNVVDHVRNPLWWKTVKGKVPNTNAVLSKVIQEVFEIGKAEGDEITTKLVGEISETLVDFATKLTKEEADKLYTDFVHDRVALDKYNGKTVSALFKFIRDSDASRASATSSLVQGLLGVLQGVKSTGKKMSGSLDKNLVDQFYSLSKKAAPAPASTKKRARDAEADLAALGRDAGDYVNTTLVFHPNVFSILDSAKARPHDPVNGGVINTDSGASSKTYYKFARSHASPYVGNLVTAPKVRKLDDSTVVRHIDDDDDEGVVDKTMPSGLDSGVKQYISQSLLQDRTGLFWTVGDQSGSVVIKQHLVNRVVYVSQKATNVFERVPALLQAYTRPTANSLIQWTNHKVSGPEECFLKVWAFIRVLAEAALMFSSAGPVGRLYFGYEDTSTQYDNSAKVYQMHYSIYYGAHVLDPTRLMLIPDVHIVGYEGGYGSRAFTDLRQFDAKNLNFETIQADYFIFSLGSNTSRQHALSNYNPLCLTGDLPNEILSEFRFKSGLELGTRRTPQWESFLYYNFIWNFTGVNSNKLYNTFSYATIKESDYQPMMAFFGPHTSLDVHGNPVHWRGTGHLGNIRTPMVESLNGKIEILTDRITANIK